MSVRPTPRAARALKSLRLPAFWILCALLALSAWRLGIMLHSPLARFPTATITAILLFGLWAVPFWLFIASMDFLEREPPLLMATAFAWGAMVATMAAMPGNRALLGLTAKLVSPDFAMAWGPAIASPLIEELLKALGLVMIVLVARKQINSVLDGMVYGALIGLGFQVVENIFYALNSVEMANEGDTAAPVVATFFLRGFLAGLWSHTLFSALAGAGIAWFLVRTDKTLIVRWGGLLVGMGLAWGIHFIWNSPLLMDGVGGSGVGLLIGLLLKGMPALLLAMGLLWVARHREANYYIDKLEELRDPKIATRGELHTLRHGHLRADARRYGKYRAGTAGQKAVKALQLAQAHLAVELSRAPNGLATGDPILLHSRDEVLAERQRLRVLAHPEAVASPLRPVIPRVAVLGMIAAIILCGLVFFAISAMHGA
ncbi:MAG TPA: PrsW family intramembrane metalloprotease [Candidatus Limnocylindrales bacterium]